MTQSRIENETGGDAGAGAPGAPRTPADAIAFLEAVRAEAPSLFAKTPPKGWVRGIDAIERTALPGVVLSMLRRFHGAHGRLPDPARCPTTADHWIRVRLFDPVPVPTPGCLFNISHYAPRWMLETIGLPDIRWRSETPEPPASDALPEGAYVYGASVGADRRIAVSWPPSDGERARLRAAGARWRHDRLGLRTGEWWYQAQPPQFFLERDPGDLLAGRPAVSIYTHRGATVAVALKGRGEDGAPDGTERLFGADLRPLEGTTRPDATVAEFEMPSRIEPMRQVAEELGARLRTARIDFRNDPGQLPGLERIALCPEEPEALFHPASLDAWVRDRLFDPPAVPTAR